MQNDDSSTEQFRSMKSFGRDSLSDEIERQYSMIRTQWPRFRYCTIKSRSPVLLYRLHNTTASRALISPALLGRAQALAAEHERLSEQLKDGYDGGLAKRVGSLATVASTLQGWQKANEV